jgi:hypothetical protein
MNETDLELLARTALAQRFPAPEATPHFTPSLSRRRLAPVLAGAAAVVLVLAVAIAIAAWPNNHSRDSTRGPRGSLTTPAKSLRSITNAVTLEDDDETFQPLSGAPPAGSLSFEEAWMNYRLHIFGHATEIPANTRVGYGELTQVEPTRVAGKQKVYAYVLRATCMTTLPTAKPDRNCRAWLFLDTKTARIVHGSPPEPR